MFLAEVDCCHIVRGLPNESHKVRIDVDFRVVRVRESRKSHMILPIPKLTWRKTIALQQTCPHVSRLTPREYVLQDARAGSWERVSRHKSTSTADVGLRRRDLLAVLPAPPRPRNNEDVSQVGQRKASRLASAGKALLVGSRMS
jgi:hypothetical protein